MPNTEKKLMPQPELHPGDAQNIKDTLSRMVVEYHTLVHDLTPEGKERINFMYVQLTDMIDLYTIKEEAEE